jgi:hypothetical protein
MINNINKNLKVVNWLVMLLILNLEKPKNDLNLIEKTNKKNFSLFLNKK